MFKIKIREFFKDFLSKEIQSLTLKSEFWAKTLNSENSGRRCKENENQPVKELMWRKVKGQNNIVNSFWEKVWIL